MGMYKDSTINAPTRTHSSNISNILVHVRVHGSTTNKTVHALPSKYNKTCENNRDIKMYVCVCKSMCITMLGSINKQKL